MKEFLLHMQIMTVWSGMLRRTNILRKKYCLNSGLAYMALPAGICAKTRQVNTLEDVAYKNRKAHHLE